MKGFKLGPEDTIRQSLSIICLRVAILLIELIKRQEFRSHFFSKYSRVIKRVFARSKVSFISFQIFFSISGKI